MNSVRLNIVANLIGQGWGALLQLAALPFYLHFLGIESYALVGFYLMLITGAQLFDLGFAQTLNRELARLSANPSRATEARDVLRTIETVYWAIIIAVCAVLFFAAQLISAHVLTPKNLAPDTVHLAVVLMVVVIALQWPNILYHSGLMGLQKQVLVNALRTGLTTIASVGAVLTLWLISPTITAFFTWQIAISALSLACMAYALYSSLPAAAHPGRFRGDLLNGMWRFAAGMSALTVSALVLTQLDKWILVNILSLEAFGYFTLAVAVANALNLLVTPIFGAIFPRFSMLVVRDDRTALLNLYHVATQAVSATMVPAAIFLSLFSFEVLWAWTGNLAVATGSGPLLSLLVIGTALNGITHLPYAWELAHGRTRVFLMINVAAIAVLGPAVWLLANRFGAIAAAGLWIVLNATYLIIAIPIIHRSMALKHRVRWLARDVGVPIAVSAGILGMARAALPENLGRMELAGVLGVILGTCLIATCLVSPGIKQILRETLQLRGKRDINSPSR